VLHSFAVFDLRDAQVLELDPPSAPWDTEERTLVSAENKVRCDPVPVDNLLAKVSADVGNRFLDVGNNRRRSSITRVRSQRLNPLPDESFDHLAHDCGRLSLNL